MVEVKSRPKSFKILAIMLSLMLVLASLGTSLSSKAFAAGATVPDKVVLTNFKVFESNATDEAMSATVSADGRTFTVDNTLEYDFEGLKATNAFPIVQFNTNVERVGNYRPDYYSAGTSFYQVGMRKPYLYSDQFNYLYSTVLPYNTDSNYVIAKFTLYAVDMTGEVTGQQWGPIASTETEFTVKFKKWEKQYQKESVAPGWQAGLLCTTYESGTEFVPWTPVPGKPHHWEYVAATNVTFPFTLTAATGIHYMTDVYLDGKRIYLPLGGGLWSEELTFSSDKTYYDFVIDPGTSMDDKHHKGTKSYWRVSVTGKATSKAPSITKQPVVTSIYYKGQKATPLRVKAQSNDGGKLSYQWYSNTKASTSGAKAIKKATKATYTPTTKAANKVYYYFCKVTNTKSGIKKISNSKVATVRVATNMNKKTVTIATNAKKTQVIEIPKSSKKANTQLALGKSKKAKNQTFVLVRDKNGYYQIKNSNSGMYLTVKGGKAKAKAAIVQAKKSASKAQKFKLGYNTGGNYLLVSALNSNYCIDLAKNSTGTGNKLILSKYSAKDKYQKFKIVAVKK